MNFISAFLKDVLDMINSFVGSYGWSVILFTLLMMAEFDFPNEEELLACVSLTVGLSILMHGITANPLARRIGQTRNPIQKGQ